MDKKSAGKGIICLDCIQGGALAIVPLHLGHRAAWARCFGGAEQHGTAVFIENTPENSQNPPFTKKIGTAQRFPEGYAGSHSEIKPDFSFPTTRAHFLGIIMGKFGVYFQPFFQAGALKLPAGSGLLWGV